MSEETTRPPRTGDQTSVDPRLGAARPDKDALEAGPRARSKRRRKVSYLTANKIDKVDYKEVNILRRFLNDRGKILPSRQTGNTAKQQRMIAQQIRRAREMALLPFVVTEMGTDRREGGRRPRPQMERQEAPVAAPAPEQEATPAAE